MSEQLGFKRLTIGNWQEPVPFLRAFGMSPKTGDDWAREVLAPTLSDQVPLEIERLFEVARGTMLYGYFFYPVFTAGMEQLFRVLEAAVSRRCIDLSAPKKMKYCGQIRWLVEKGVIFPEAEERWQNLRKLRNHASHLKDQTIVMPGTAINAVHGVTVLINTLFSAS